MDVTVDESSERERSYLGLKIGVSVGLTVVEGVVRGVFKGVDDGGVTNTPWLRLSLLRGPCSLLGEIVACLFNILKLFERIVTTRKRVETIIVQKHAGRENKRQQTVYCWEPSTCGVSHSVAAMTEKGISG